MSAQASKFPHLPLLIVGVAAFSTGGIGAIIGWLTASTNDSHPILAQDDLALAPAEPVAVTTPIRSK